MMTEPMEMKMTTSSGITVTSVDADELKPCPFCGGSDLATFGPYGWYREWGISHSCPAFYCGTSDAFKGYPTKAEAIAAWNRRAALTPSPLPAQERPAAVVDEAMVERVCKALIPFSRFAGELFAKNYNRSDTVAELCSPEGESLLITAGHFFDARAALTPTQTAGGEQPSVTEDRANG